ncbi:MAG: hypothetical protein AAFP81_02085 [Pseudomonadota bacterium]
MSAIVTTSSVLDEALRGAGLEEAFDDRGVAYEDCPGCGATRGLKLSLARGRVHCGACGTEGPLLAYLREKTEASDWNNEPYSEAEIIPIEPRLPKTQAAADPIETGLVEIDVPASVTAPSLPTKPHSSDWIEQSIPEPDPPRRDNRDHGKWGERMIISLLAVIFLGAGLAAATLSGFANFQAFSIGVQDPAQAQIWGWSGVIASVCSFGGFTFFWWHVSGGRRGEAARALVFALAGAGTSIAGTTLYMMNNADGQRATWQGVTEMRAVAEAEIAQWTRQLDGIPAETRSIDGLEAYLAGVEAAGRTHQKPYRDAQNELGLAKRRAELETKIETARDELKTSVGTGAEARPAQSLPAWFFAMMLELFSSQATSIAFVSLLLLYGRQSEAGAPPDDGECAV